MATREIKTTIAIDGEKQFKSALSEAQRSLRVMQADLKAETSAFDANTSAQQKAETRARSLKTQIEQQKKVVEALKGAVSDSAKKWGENSAQTDGYRIKLANAQKTLNDMTHELEDAEKASDGLNQSFKETMTQMGPELKNTLSAAGSVLSSIGKAGAAAFGAVTAAAAGTVKGVADLVGETSVSADNLLTQALQTGIDVETLQAWSYAARFVDTEVSSITDSIKKLRTNMQTTDAETGMNEALRELGVSAIDSAGRYRDAVDVFWDVIDAAHENLKGYNETELETYLNALMGEGYTDLLPLIRDGRLVWEEAVSQAYAGGLVMDQATVEDFGEYNNKLQRIDAAWSGIKNSMAAIALEYADPIADGIGKVGTAFNRLLRGEDGAGDDLASSIDQLFADAQTALQTGWDALNETIDALSGSDNENAQKLGGALGALRDGLENIAENKDSYIKALEALFGVMVGTKAAEAATKMWELGKSVKEIITGLNTLGILTPQTAALGAAAGVVAYGANHPERSTLQPEYYEAATGTTSDIENLKAWITAQNAANAATYDMSVNVDTARALNEAAQAARDALLSTTGGQDLMERYAGFLNTVDGYDGTVMPDIPEEWAAQIEGEMQEALHQTELSVDPSIAENGAASARATLQSYLNNMGLTVEVTPNVSGASSALTTGRWVSALVEGSHADGLDYVPHDNYIAALHRGEKILTAAEAARYRAAETAYGTGQTGGDAAAWRRMMNAIGYMLANVKVQIDGQTAGSLLAPVVSEAIAKEFMEG